MYLGTGTVDAEQQLLEKDNKSTILAQTIVITMSLHLPGKFLRGSY